MRIGPFGRYVLLSANAIRASLLVVIPLASLAVMVIGLLLTQQQIARLASVVLLLEPMIALLIASPLPLRLTEHRSNN